MSGISQTVCAPQNLICKTKYIMEENTMKKKERTDFKVNGETNQVMSAFMTRAEGRMSATAFMEFLNKSQENDPENFMLNTLKVNEEYVAVVLSEHVFKRAMQRTIFTRAKMIERVMALLSNPYVIGRVRSHQVMWDDDQHKVISFDEDGIMATAVYDEESGTVYVFEAGFNYIRLKTVCGVSVDNPFRVTTSLTAPIRLSKTGAIECRPENIPEISYQKKFHDNISVGN